MRVARAQAAKAKERIWVRAPRLTLVGLRGGVFTAIEAGVVAVVYTLVIGFFVYREMTLKIAFKSLLSAAKMSAVVMFLAGPILNVACATGNVKMGEIIGPTMPYFIAQVALVFLLAIFPGLIEVPLAWFGG